MNEPRRREIRALVGKLSHIIERLNVVSDDEQSALDNVPESFQETERAEAMQSAVDVLESVGSEIENCTHELQELL